MAYTGVKTLASPYVVSRLVPDVAGEFDLAELALREGPQEKVLIHLLPPLKRLKVTYHILLSHRSW
jgi:hypothetical protein